MNQGLNFKAMAEMENIKDLQRLEQDFIYLDSPQTKPKVVSSNGSHMDESRLSDGMDKTGDASLPETSFKFSYPSKEKGFAERLVEDLK